MRLLELKIKNFKGIKNLIFRPDGRNAKIYGRTGSGKTTVADAFRWLITGKDTKDRADFALKPIGHDGAKSGIDHEVSATIKHDGKSISLKKIYKEKWTKKKNVATKQFTGHTTDYYVDGVPVKEKDYRKFILSVMGDETVFKLLTDPLYFSEVMPWQERRKLLFRLCSDLPSDKEIMDGDKGFSGINEFLDGRSVDSCRLIIKAMKKEINKALNEIPTRIDEASRAMSTEDPGRGEEAVKDGIAKLKQQINEFKERKLMMENDKGTMDKKNELNEIRHRISGFILDYERKVDEEKTAAEKTLIEKEREYDDISHDEDLKGKAFKAADDEIDDIEARIINLRHQWHEENDKKFAFEEIDVCPACGQPLPEEKVQAARNNALEIFNKTKSKKLELIHDEGRGLAASADILKKDRERLEKDINAIKERKGQLGKSIESIEKQIENIKGRRDRYTRQKEYKDLARQEIAITAELQRLMSGDKEEIIIEMQRRIAEEEQKLDGLENELLRIHQNREQEKRIKDLMDKEKALAKEFDELERRLFLLDNFTRRKVELIEDKISNRFGLARFKLFNQLVNGDIEDCCEVTNRKGVPFSSGLSGGERLSMGLDIISTFSGDYGMSFPIFIDDAVLTTDEIRTPGQQIRLYILKDRPLEWAIDQED